MSMPYPFPYAEFTGMYGNAATGGWSTAQAYVANGYVSLWTMGPAGWVQLFSVPANQVTVKSAAQRITLVVHGQSYPILADLRPVDRATGLRIVSHVAHSPGVELAADAGRFANQVTAAQAFSAGGGNEFLAAARQSGAGVSRLGWGGLAAISCGGGVLAVSLVVVVLIAAFSL